MWAWGGPFTFPASALDQQLLEIECQFCLVFLLGFQYPLGSRIRRTLPRELHDGQGTPSVIPSQVILGTSRDPFYRTALYHKRNVDHCTLSSVSWWSLALGKKRWSGDGRYVIASQLAETFCINLDFEKDTFYKFKNITPQISIWCRDKNIIYLLIYLVYNFKKLADPSYS